MEIQTIFILSKYIPILLPSLNLGCISYKLCPKLVQSKITMWVILTSLGRVGSMIILHEVICRCAHLDNDQRQFYLLIVCLLLFSSTAYKYPNIDTKNT